MSEDGARVCGACSLCCTLLRVDELGKPGGTSCVHQCSDGPGCGIHATRPSICRAYRCLWLQGSLEDQDRPDRLGALLDLRPVGEALRLEVVLAQPGGFDASPRLQAIAERYRGSMPVRITDLAAPLDPDAPFRVLLPDGEEQRVAGERVQRLRDGRVVAEQRLPWLERRVRRLLLAWSGFRLRRAARRRDA
jgi:hypothetical protein